MKLIYRGTTFDYDSSSTPSRPFQTNSRPREAYNLMYRGVTYRVDPNAITKADAKPATYELSYRGVTYKVNRDEQGEVKAISSLKPSNHKIFTTTDLAIQQEIGEVVK